MNFKHGLRHSSEYSSWYNMKTRCYNENNPKYKDYGARGIVVCDRWLHSFENFYADMGPKPTELHSLDRIDNNGNYTPENCHWASNIQQANNKRQIAVNAFCRNGHEMSGGNIYYNPDLTRRCRTCKLTADKARRNRNANP